MTSTRRSCSSSSRRSSKLSLIGALAVILTCCAARACGSAIPMWEFLTRDEKLSHLYRIFSQEVTEYCAESTMPDCNKNLLIGGLRNLAHMENDQLDELDPYQRGAKDIIWRAMVGSGNRLTGSRLGGQQQQHHHHQQQQHQLNQQQHNSFQANDADPLAVGDNQLPQESIASHDYVHPTEHSGPYLTGPMVIRVYPDGSPVPNDAQRPLPKDEDIEEIRYNARLPLIKDLEASKKSSSSSSSSPSPTSSSSSSVPAAAEQKINIGSSYEPPREMLPPRQSVRSTNFYRPLVAAAPSSPVRFYSRIARPNNLLIRERYY